MKKYSKIRRFLLSSFTVALLSIAAPLFADTDTNQPPIAADTTSSSPTALAVSHKKVTVSASIFAPFGLQYDLQARLTPHWSIGAQAFQMPDIISSIISNHEEQLWSYAVSARYYILHDFGTTGFYISPTLHILTKDSAFSGDDIYFGLGELSLGFQWPILNYMGLDLSAGVMADLGKHDSDDSRFAGVFSAGIDFLF